MQKNLEQILNTILHSSEILEEKMKQDSDLKDLTSRQLYCIELINKMENPSLTELADGMSIAKASISVMIDRLEKKKLIYKVTSDNDRRTAHVHLTEIGMKAASIHTDLHKRISELLTKDMTESEKEILIVLLNKSVKSLIKNKMQISN
ncbi:MarR family transcriptional regulator [Mariniphaga sediminis]|uniref:MarR family transcriptional regulator n=1 Tax=Mariniphaga sediminis TaxID=1628158 RepID=A0A399D4C3_9BACT|nr:MarR family transcriptional regulator [Mariniphaga sediminis]RIH65270.1 MarR family transcriptional regulator [Mariniphaga sediminis]